MNKSPGQVNNSNTRLAAEGLAAPWRAVAMSVNTHLCMWLGRTLLIASFYMALYGCASNHDLRNDGFNAFGGGISIVEIEPGEYSITAQTNFSPVENFSTARTMWNEAAQKACAPNSYGEIESREYSFKHAPDFIVIPYIISVKTGSIRCVLEPVNTSSKRDASRAVAPAEG